MRESYINDKIVFIEQHKHRMSLKDKAMIAVESYLYSQRKKAADRIKAESSAARICNRVQREIDVDLCDFESSLIKKIHIIIREELR